MSFNESMAPSLPYVDDASQARSSEVWNSSSPSIGCSSCSAPNCLRGYVRSHHSVAQYNFPTVRDWGLSTPIHQSEQQPWLEFGIGGSPNVGFGGSSQLTEDNNRRSMLDVEYLSGLGNTNTEFIASETTIGTISTFPVGQHLPEIGYGEIPAGGRFGTFKRDVFQTPYNSQEQSNVLVPQGWSSHPDEIQSYHSSVSNVHVIKTTEPSQDMATDSSSRSSPRPLSCHYPSCDMTFARRARELKLHLNNHIGELLQHWVNSTACRWPSCTSAVVFKTRKTYQTHLENIHACPLVCPVRGCKHKTPFRSNHDLERHTKTIHISEKEWNCPYVDCPKSTEPFPRKDKWLKHLRHHPANDFACPLPHCNTETMQSFQSQAQVVEHIQGSHGKYECALGACLNDRRSRFSEFGLLQHLELEHSLTDEACTTACNSMKSQRERTVSPQHLSASGGWENCSTCT
ncbi:hypothetical protein B0J14DRAFT_50740 [Halenospora varia]|nr:hypothetical protein B0J14DRAFT_50740 [Halenospora varia]